MIAPMSGPWARQGELIKMGADLAIEDINDAGGIKALGGAKMTLVVCRCRRQHREGQERGAAPARRRSPTSPAAPAPGVSSFTLAVTEVTERAELPWLTLSYSDQITNRGFKYVFQTSPTADGQAATALPTVLHWPRRRPGKKPPALGDRDGQHRLAGQLHQADARRAALDKLGMKLVVDETFTPPLSDATPLVQKVRSARPDMLLLLPTNVPDDKLVLEKLNEMGLGQGRLPIVSNGGHMGSPELLKALGQGPARGRDVRRSPTGAARARRN